MRASTALAGILMCAVVSALATGQAAANLLTNAGFETGDLTGWLALNTIGNPIPSRMDTMAINRKS